MCQTARENRKKLRWRSAAAVVRLGALKIENATKSMVQVTLTVTASINFSYDHTP